MQGGKALEINLTSEFASLYSQHRIPLFSSSRLHTYFQNSSI
jgi:hypothetical protein